MESSLQIIAVIIVLLNSIAIYINNKAKNIDELYNDAKINIYNEYLRVLKSYSTLMNSEIIQENKLDDEINSMRKIHFSGNLDNYKLEMFKKEILKIRDNALIGFGCAIISFDKTLA